MTDDLRALGIVNRINSQYPKKCACGREWTRDGWTDLQWVGVQTDSFATLELRNCHCGSTLAVILKIHDETQE